MTFKRCRCYPGMCWPIGGIGHLVASAQVWICTCIIGGSSTRNEKGLHPLAHVSQRRTITSFAGLHTRLTPYSVCAASFFSWNSVFLSQQFSHNSIFQPISAKILSTKRGIYFEYEREPCSGTRACKKESLQLNWARQTLTLIVSHSIGSMWRPSVYRINGKKKMTRIKRLT